MNLYPLQFHPIYKERIWGGNKLREVLGKNTPGGDIGESWEISAVPGNYSIVSNGTLAGKSLQQLIIEYGDQLLGKKNYHKFGLSFPILIKFIDARQNLSVQLHPNDRLAQERHQCCGKTEMWYILQADEASRLIIGFARDITKEEYKHHLETNTLPEILNYETVTQGDAFFINPGKIHAIGAGILLAEIQQTSDITYRVYDYNRTDKDGKPRELHTQLAWEAMDYTRHHDYKLSYKKKTNIPNLLAQCPYFTTAYLSLAGRLTQTLAERDSFTIYICVEGQATVTTADTAETIWKGETLLLPASIDQVMLTAEKASLLEVYI